MTQKRIGFACKWIDFPEQTNKVKSKDACRELHNRTTTVAWLSRQTAADAEQRMWEIMQHNLAANFKLVERVSQLPDYQKMVRLGSDILPMYTQQDWAWFWKQPDVQQQLETGFAKIGELARARDVRLSFHPGQFTVLASDNPEIVDRSVEEFEYHVDMARWMGYGRKFQDFKINVHISGRQGPAGIKAVCNRLSPEARNTLTIENDEMCWGVDASLELQGICALVLDIHHHWVRTGEYIQSTDDRFNRIIDSWRGVRPVIHYSYSRNEHLPDQFTHDDRPDMALLLEAGHKKQKLRAHSDFYPNSEVNSWALTFLEHADIMCESKAKNLASTQLAKQAIEQGFLV